MTKFMLSRSMIILFKYYAIFIGNYSEWMTEFLIHILSTRNIFQTFKDDMLKAILFHGKGKMSNANSNYHKQLQCFLGCERKTGERCISVCLGHY